MREVEPERERLGRRQLGERGRQGRDQRAGLPGQVGVIDGVAVPLGVGPHLLRAQLADRDRLGDLADQGPAGDRAGVERPQRLGSAIEADPVHHQRRPGVADLGRQRRGDPDRHQLDARRHVVPRRVQPAEHLRGRLGRVHVGGLGQLPVPRPGPQPERGDHAEEAGSGAPGGPEQVGVARLVAPLHLAVGGHHLDRVDRLGRPAPASAVPAHPALQQEAAEPDRRAVPAGEEPPPGGEERVEVDAAPDRRAGRDDAGVVVVAHPGEGGQVDEERVVAERPGGPAVPARADGDPQALGRRQPHPGGHVGRRPRRGARRRAGSTAAAG